MDKDFEYKLQMAQFMRYTDLDETDPSVQRYAANLRRHHDSSIQVPDTISRDPLDIIMAAIAGLHAQVARVANEMIEQRSEMGRMERRLEKRIDRSVETRIDGIETRLGVIEDRMTISQRLNEFPPANEITKMKAQFWNNTAKNKRKRDELKAKGDKGGGTLANHQLEIYVWTCPLNKAGKFTKGNVEPFFIPVYVPGASYTKRKLGHDLDHLPQQNVKWMGMLVKQRRGKHPDQAGVIERDNRLRLFIRGVEFDLGLPTEAPSDAHPDAARLRWDWPETRG
jgi:hypothetical protein